MTNDKTAPGFSQAQYSVFSIQYSVFRNEPLRSTEYWLLNTEYLRSVCGCVSTIAICFLLSGCSPKNGDPLRSQFFSEVQIIGTRGTAPGQFIKPRSVALDANDNLFVVDMTGRVQKFSPTGIFISSWQMPQTDKGKPKGMCRDAEGNIVVVEPHYSRVNHFTPAGQPVRQWGVHGTNAGQLALPRAVAVSPRGMIFVSEYGVTERVQMFSADGLQLLRVI